MEYFTSDQQDIKTKTKNWCYKLQQTGFLSQEQFSQCISTFTDATTGILPKDFDSPLSGIEHNYSLYNTKQQKKLSSNITTDVNNNTDNNSNAIMLTSSDGTIIACNSQNIMYSVNNINDSTVKQNELYFILDKQASTTDSNTYAIISPYGKFLSINSNLGVSFTGINANPATQWNIIKINSSGTTTDNPNDNTIMIEPIQYKNYHLIYDTETQTLQTKYGISSNTEWLMTSKPSNSDDTMDNKTNSINNKYTLSNKEIIFNIYDIKIKKICITELINTYKLLINKITTQYNAVINLIKKTYQNTNANTDTNANMTISTNIEDLCDNLTTIQTNLTTNIDTKYIKPLQALLDDIILREKKTNYDEYISTLQSEYDIIDNSIKQNSLIIDRQTRTNNALNNTYNNTNTKDKRLLNNDKIISVNSDIVNNMNTQYSYTLKLYPLFILILIILLIYLIYITTQKYINNIM